jgi:hypothetical protein
MLCAISSMSYLQKREREINADKRTVIGELNSNRIRSTSDFKYDPCPPIPTDRFTYKANSLLASGAPASISTCRKKELRSFLLVTARGPHLREGSSAVLLLVVVIAQLRVSRALPKTRNSSVNRWPLLPQISDVLFLKLGGPSAILL